MFRKLISSLVIISMLVSDLSGWGNRSASAMIEPDEQRQIIPIQHRDGPDETPLQGESLEDINGPKSHVDSERESSTTGSEKDRGNDRQLILDLGQGISSAKGDGESLNLSPLKLATVSLTLFSPRAETENDMVKGNASSAQSSSEGENTPLPDHQVPEEKKETFVLNRVEKKVQEDANLQHTLPFIKEFDEKTPLLQPQKRLVLFAEESQEKKTEKTDNLTKDWELAGGESDEELVLKRKSDGIHTDQSDGPSFEGDIRVARSETQQEPKENFIYKKEKMEASLRALLNESDDLECSSDRGTGYSGMENSPLPESQRSGVELTNFQNQAFLSGAFNPFSMKIGKPTSEKKRPSFPYEGHRGSLEKRSSYPSQGLNINGGGGSELGNFSEYEGSGFEDFAVDSVNPSRNLFAEEEDLIIPLDQIRNLSPEVEDFLRHVKVRIIDGKLNWKQWLGIGGGIVIGAGCAWPWMVIMFRSLLEIYAHNVDVYYNSRDGNVVHIVDPNVLDTQFRNFNSYLNFKNMIGLVGIPMGISVASSTASIFVDLTKDSIHSFSFKKSTKHSLILWATKGGAYCGAFFAGLLPVYYLFHSLLGCDLNDFFYMNTQTEYGYYISTDIFLNISTNIDPYVNCTFQSIPPKNFQLFGIGGAFLFLSTFFRYGHQVSKTLIKWVNDDLFVKAEDNSRLSVEAIVQEYLVQFKDLKKIIYAEKVGELNLLYDSIFLNNLRKIEQGVYISSEGSKSFESLRVLKVLQDFYYQHKNALEEETSGNWKKTWASRLGWAIPLISTFGRMLIFQYVISEFLGTRWGSSDDNAELIDYIEPSIGATIGSSIFGFFFAHLTQGVFEKEAVEKCIYELLGGHELTHGHSHRALRISLKIWDYLYGVFHTLPYLVIGFSITTNHFNWPNLYQLSAFSLNTGQILFLISFGIADIFNNAAAYQQSSSILVNGFDSLFSYYYPFESYKRDKLLNVTQQFRQLFKEMESSVLQEIHKIFGENHEGNNNVLKKNGSQKNMIRMMEQSNIASSGSGDPSVFNELLKNCENAGEKPYSHHTFSFETQEFLKYFKTRIVKGTLNWQQKTGIVGGLITGLAISWPMMAIIFYGLLTPYFQSFRPSTYLFFSSPLTPLMGKFPPDVIMDGLARFNKYTNFYLLAAFIGLPLGIDAASRTATLLSSMTAEKSSSFSIQKTRIHGWTLLGVKSGIYFSTFFASTLPVYYLYDSLFGSFQDPCSNLTCDKLQGWFQCPQPFNNGTSYCPNGTPYCPGELPNVVYSYTVATDIFFNITGIINSPHFCGEPPELSRKILFGIGAPFLFFDTFLQYGYPFSLTAERWIDNYFFAKMHDSSHLSSLEVKRKKYLTQLKNLKRIIYELEENEVDGLYDKVFENNENTVKSNVEVTPESLTMNEDFHVLMIFQNFYDQHQTILKNNEEGDWKKTSATRVGWGISLIATFGRILIFQYVLAGVLGATADSFSISIPDIGVTILSCILGGIFANIAQGWMEKDAVEKGVYDLLRGDKIPDGSSHPHLRRSIKAWDYLYGLFNTLPYLFVGLAASGYILGAGELYTSEQIAPWRVLLLISFGIADAFNNAVGFHDSNLGVVNAYDSLVTSYGIPSTEQKKDRLIRMTRQLRRLFKDLHPDVLEEVDRELNKNSQNVQDDEYEGDFEQGKEEYCKSNKKDEI